MLQILRYLELKNMYYEKFLSISKKFLLNARLNQWGDLTLFVDNRERILNIIHTYDHKIAHLFEEIDPMPSELNSYKHQIKTLLSKRKELINKIVEIDLELISRIEEMKNETIKELKFNLEKQQQLEFFSDKDQTQPIITKTV